MENMKKKILFISLWLTVAIAVSYQWSVSKKYSLDSLVLANVEALARYEGNPECPNGCISSPYSYCICYKIYTNMREAKW